MIITTYNRRDALLQTLAALGRQTVPKEQYEILVVDDGSQDGTYEAAAAAALPCTVRAFRHDRNRGISAGRNLAIRAARGRYLVCVSDDLLVPETFLAAHLETLGRYPGYWVVGGFDQLPSLTASPFGRYLDDLERGYKDARVLRAIAPDVFELVWPTARNLSLPAADLERTGLFDERFRVTCEDQDLAERARAVGIRFLYNAAITCLHNDQAGDLPRFCRAQRRGAHDTVLLVAKYPDLHGRSPLVRVNGYARWADGLGLLSRKATKAFLSTELGLSVTQRVIAFAEFAGLPERRLWPLYRFLIGLCIFRGWREGLRTLESMEAG